MTSYHQGFLAIGEQSGEYRELFNHARTAAYLESSDVLGCNKVSGVLADGGCAAYPWVPPLTEGGPSEYSEEAPNGWFKQQFTTPDDGEQAPWYNPSYPESAQALGFWITEWTGLDSGHIKSEVAQRSLSGGALGRTSSSSREMGFEVILLAESEAAMDYLYRWLDATISAVCSTCSTDSIILRRTCPDINPLDLDTVANGVVEMRGVGMMSGLQWGSPPVINQGCFIRTVNFTMGAMDPCMYGFCTDVDVAAEMDWATCFAGGNVNTLRSGCRPTCSEMPEECRTTFDFSIDTPGASAPIITVTAPLLGPSIAMRIRTYANPNALTPGQLCGAPLLAELHLLPFPPYTEVRYDMPGRTILIRNAGTGRFVNGFAYVSTNSVGIPRFAALGCGDYTVVVEPDDFCFEGAPSANGEYSDVTAMVQERQGCA